MPKSQLIDPHVERAPRSLSCPTIPLNAYSRTLAQERKLASGRRDVTKSYRASPLPSSPIILAPACKVCYDLNSRKRGER